MKIHIPEFTRKLLTPWALAVREVATSRFYAAYLALIGGFGAVVYGLAAKYDAGFTVSSALYS
ncbi:MAG TPA: hypothetical protein VGD95_07075, partial [Micavibrio sp.]